MMKQTDKGSIFRRLHAEAGCFVIPNPWDAGSAVLLEQMGFKALATTSAGLAYSLGRPDGENALLREEVLDNARQIAAATSLPVSADLEGGFGESPAACAETIRLAAEAGLAGGSIEDATGNAERPIHDIGLARERIAAAAEAGRGISVPFMLTARAENFIYGNPDLADTIKRLQAFQEAGADVLFAPGLRSVDDIRTVVSAIDRPLNVVMGLTGLKFTVAQLAELGVKRVSVGGSLVRTALGAFLRAAREIHEQGTFNYADSAIPDAEITSIFRGSS